MRLSPTWLVPPALLTAIPKPRADYSVVLILVLFSPPPLQRQSTSLPPPQVSVPCGKVPPLPMTALLSPSEAGLGYRTETSIFTCALHYA